MTIYIIWTQELIVYTKLWQKSPWWQQTHSLKPIWQKQHQSKKCEMLINSSHDGVQHLRVPAPTENKEIPDMPPDKNMQMNHHNWALLSGGGSTRQTGRFPVIVRSRCSALKPGWAAEIKWREPAGLMDSLVCCKTKQRLQLQPNWN